MNGADVADVIIGLIVLAFTLAGALFVLSYAGYIAACVAIETWHDYITKRNERKEAQQVKHTNEYQTVLDNIAHLEEELGMTTFKQEEK